VIVVVVVKLPVILRDATKLYRLITKESLRIDAMNVLSGNGIEQLLGCSVARLESFPRGGDDAWCRASSGEG
jgi:hypothetical protein